MTEADVLRAENAIFREQIQQLQREKDSFWRLILQVQEEKESSRKQNQDLMKQNQDLMKNLNEKDLFIDRMATEHRNDRLGINTRLDSLIESQRSMVNRIVQGQRTIMSTLDGGIEAVRDRLGNIEARLTTHPESTAKVHGFGIVHQRSCNGGNFVRFISGQEQYVRRQLRRRVPQETRHNRVLRNFTPHANGINTRNILASIANRQIGQTQARGGRPVIRCVTARWNDSQNFSIEDYENILNGILQEPMATRNLLESLTGVPSEMRESLFSTCNQLLENLEDFRIIMYEGLEEFIS